MTARRRTAVVAGRRDKATLVELLDHDTSIRAPYVIGADEAGRGCLAGPIVAAAVCFDRRKLRASGLQDLVGLGDSKKLTLKMREELYPAIFEVAERVSVVSRSAVAIDALGIQWANLNAMQTAAERVMRPRAVVLIDGFRLPDAPFRHQQIIRGDNTSAAIAAASVVAKVTRDRMMEAAARRWPQYGFDRHAGYPTPFHKAALREHGPCPMHRISFANR
jgi:ribonuclease HII